MRKALYMVLAFGLLSASFATLNKNSYELKRQPKVGDSLKYHIDAQFRFKERSANMSMEQTETVSKVESTGNFEVETKGFDGKLTVDGHDQDLPGDPGTLSVYNSLGALQSIHEANDPSAYRKAYMIEFIAPDHQVGVGDNWEREFRSDSPLGVSAKSSYKVEAVEKIGGVNAAKVSFSYTETEGAAPIASEGYTWVKVRDGSVMKLEAKFKNLPMGASAVPVDGSFSMKRAG